MILIKEIDDTRTKLHSLISQNNDDLNSLDILSMSQELDLLLVEYIAATSDTEAVNISCLGGNLK